MTLPVDDFLKYHGWDQARRIPIDANASTRILARLVQSNGTTAILMDKGPELPPHNRPFEQTIMPDLKPFAQVDGILRSLDLSAPKIYAASPDGAYLLVEDFGQNEIERVLKSGQADEAKLFPLAIEFLLELQRRFQAKKPDMTGLRNYSPEFFLSHLSVIPLVYMPLLCGGEPKASVRAEFDRLWLSVLQRACATPTSLMLRDCNVSNLFYLPNRPGINACGVIDFETAGTGPVIYDMVAMLRDKRFSASPETVEKCINLFLSATPSLTRSEFDAAYNILGTMRQVQWAGSCSLYTTQGRKGFLEKIPGIWAVIEGTLQHPAMSELRDWFNEHIPAQYRTGEVKA